MISLIHGADIRTAIGPGGTGIQAEAGGGHAACIDGRAITALAGENLTQTEIADTDKERVRRDVANTGKDTVDVVVVRIGGNTCIVDAIPEDVVLIDIAGGRGTFHRPTAGSGEHADVENGVVPDGMVAAAGRRKPVVIHVVDEVVVS